VCVCYAHLIFSTPPLPPRSTLFPYTTLFRSGGCLSGRTGHRILEGSGGDKGTVSDRAALCADDRSADARTIIERMEEGSAGGHRSEEHTSELQSRFDLVCRLLLEKKKEKTMRDKTSAIKNRNFLTRCDRIDKLLETERRMEGDKIIRLIKCRVNKLPLKNKNKAHT